MSTRDRRGRPDAAAAEPVAPVKETETYTKVHDFLFDDLGLTYMMARVFSFILTKWLSGKTVYGQSFVAGRCHMSVRECKHVFRCLQGIGIVRKAGVVANGRSAYEPAIDRCGSTTEARELLVHAMHQCTACTGAENAPARCTACTFGGARTAPQIIIKNIKNINNKNNNHDDKKRKYSPAHAAEDGDEFDGHDTL